MRAELAAVGLDPSPVALDDALHAGFDFFDTVWLHEHRTPSSTEIVEAILSSLRARVSEESRARLTHEYEDIVLAYPPELMPGAAYTLPRLAERYRLAVICSTRATRRAACCASYCDATACSATSSTSSSPTSTA